MNLTQAQAAGIVETFISAVNLRNGLEVGICPPYTALHVVRDVIAKSHIKLGAQNVFWAPKGAFTGFVSAPMLSDAGVEMCIIGHSETRGRFGKLETPESTVPFFAETDETVNLKLKALLFSNIIPILCVGETKAEREAGTTDDTIKSQLANGLAGLDDAELHTLVVAYEPVWAIGTGLTCDTPEAERVCAMIRATLAELFSPELADAVRILYGGSVKAANAADLFSQPNIDGGLVGGAALDATEFASIVGSAAL